jgi:hypothetical protein
MEDKLFKEVMESANEALADSIERKTEIIKSGCRVCGGQIRNRSRLDKAVPRVICKKCSKAQRKEQKDINTMASEHNHWFKTERSECPGCHKMKITICPKKGTCITCCLGSRNETMD